MSLFHLYKAPRVLQLSTHDIYEVLNGQMDVRNIKLLHINAGVTLGGHSHDFYEGKMLLDGKILYQLKHRFNNFPEARIVMEPYDVMILAPNVIHTAYFPERCTVIDFSALGFFSSSFNNIV